MNSGWRGLAALGALLASAATGPAWAGGDPVPRTIDVSHFRLAPGGSLLITDAAHPLPSLGFAVTFHADLATGGVLVAVDGGGNPLPEDPVRRRLGLQLLAALGLFDRAEIGIGALAIPYQAGSLERFEAAAGALPAAALGDLHVRLKLSPFAGDHGFTVAALADLGLPTGSNGAFSGERTATFTPWLLAGLRLQRFEVGVNVGWTLRRETRLADLEIDDELRLSLGARLDIVPRRFSALVDGYVKIGTAARPLGPEEVPAEVMGALRLYVGSFALQAGAGLGLGTGYGAPAMRFFAGGGWQPPVDAADADGDAIPAAIDRCPREAEDVDGFQDDDGCLDPDDDGDGILDPVDRCRLEPEDRDAFEDADGCPDPDNDRDGLGDAKDRCPLQAEDRDGFEDDDGCPDPDDDRDGLLDAKDGCPREPEDSDGFEDADGCPDPDNDRDGIADALDRCPVVAEDSDGFEDTDGCPDPDNDGDGLLDAADRCPKEAETFNGVDDADGCPDKGKVLVVVKSEKLEIKDKVFFDFGKATINKKSHRLLETVVAALRAHAEITRVRIEGHTDEVGTREYNLELSANRAKAVMAWLVEHGVDPGRLESAGFGFDRPLSPGKKKKDRELNRRVELVIVERAPD